MALLFEIVETISVNGLDGYSFVFEHELARGNNRLTIREDASSKTVSSMPYQGPIYQFTDTDNIDLLGLRLNQHFNLPIEKYQIILKNLTILNIKQSTQEKRQDDIRSAIVRELKQLTNDMSMDDRVDAKTLRQQMPGTISDHIIKYLHCVTIPYETGNKGDILVYRNGVYQRGGESYIAAIIEEGIGHRITTRNMVEETLAHIQRKTFRTREEFDKEPYIINLKNGLLDITTGKVLPHTPDHLSRIQLPVEYNKTARCPKILKFLCEVMPDRGERLGLLEEAATILIKNTKFQKAYMHIGEGANGKSTWFKVLIALLGSVNVSAIPLHDFNKDDKFALSGLDGKIANIHADISEEEMEDTSNIKITITGDKLRVQEKHKPAYDLMPTLKLIFAANKLPTIKDRTKAFLRRWIIHRWKKRFIGEEDNKHLIDELTTKEELSGLLNILIALAVKLQTQKDLSYSPSVEQIEQDWLENSDHKLTFLNAYTSLNPNGYVVKQELLKRYLVFCKQKSYAADSDTTFFSFIAQQYTEKCDTAAQHRIRKAGTLDKKGKAVRIVKGMMLNKAGIELCKLEDSVTAVTGFLSHINYRVLSPENNMLSKPCDTCDTPPCLEGCKKQSCLNISNIISPTDQYGDLCGIEELPTPRKRVRAKRTSCYVLWKGSEQNQINDLEASGIRYITNSLKGDNRR